MVNHRDSLEAWLVEPVFSQGAILVQVASAGAAVVDSAAPEMEHPEMEHPEAEPVAPASVALVAGDNNLALADRVEGHTVQAFAAPASILQAVAFEVDWLVAEVAVEPFSSPVPFFLQEPEPVF